MPGMAKTQGEGAPSTGLTTCSENLKNGSSHVSRPGDLERITGLNTPPATAKVARTNKGTVIIHGDSRGAGAGAFSSPWGSWCSAGRSDERGAGAIFQPRNSPKKVTNRARNM